MNILGKLKIPLLCFLCTLHLTVFGYSQSINIEAKNMTLLEVMKSIQAQSGYVFFINGKDIANIRISASIKDKSLEEAIQLLLNDHPVQWVLNEKTILLRPKEIAGDEKNTTGPRTLSGVQQHVQGTITDEAGVPLEGVSIRVVNSNVVASTDRNGRFTIVIPANRSTITIRLLGHAQLQVDLSGRAVTKRRLRKLSLTHFTNYGKAKIKWSLSRRSGHFCTFPRVTLVLITWERPRTEFSGTRTLLRIPFFLWIPIF